MNQHLGSLGCGETCHILSLLAYLMLSQRVPVFSSTVRFLDNSSTPGHPLYTSDTQSVISGLFKITEGQALVYVALILLSVWTSSEPIKVSISEMNFTLSFPYPSPDFGIFLEQQHPPTPVDRREIFKSLESIPSILFHS